jgi:hypothetical protein
MADANEIPNIKGTRMNTEITNARKSVADALEALELAKKDLARLIKTANVLGNLKTLESLTEDNFHGEAYELGARLLEDKDLADEFKLCNQLHQKAGWLRPPVRERRDAAYEKMMKLAFDVLGEENYKSFYRCF